MENQSSWHQEEIITPKDNNTESPHDGTLCIIILFVVSWVVSGLIGIRIGQNSPQTPQGILQTAPQKMPQ